MAEEAFALSPISARAMQPNEADYDAIKDAFMETSRGRWFLGEYAKRNRNADTTMVLDAVARIEETIAASRKPTRDPQFDEALTSLRTALGEARELATTAINDFALEQNLAPIRKGVRVVREIAWRLREIGADGRICDLIDSQLAAIEGAAGKLCEIDLPKALTGAFDTIEQKLASFDPITEASPAKAPTDEATSSPQERDVTPEALAQALATEDVSPSPAPIAEADVEVAQAAEVTPPQDVSTAQDTVDQVQAPPAEASAAETHIEEPAEAIHITAAAEQTAAEASETIQATAAAVEMERTAKTAPDSVASAVEPVAPASALSMAATPAETASEPVDAFDAGDEALLNMIAMEMAAPDTDAAYEPARDPFMGELVGKLDDSVEDVEMLETLVVEAPPAASAEPRARKTEEPEAQEAPPQQIAADKSQKGAGSWEIDVSFASDATPPATTPFSQTAAGAPPVATAPASAPQPIRETASASATDDSALEVLAEPKPVFVAPTLPAAIATPESLGSSLLASGLVSRPRTKPDPLAAIRRMSQNEKLAFFS
jgi:hypothetical protein